jgi:hypothetical protein
MRISTKLVLSSTSTFRKYERSVYWKEWNTEATLFPAHAMCAYTSADISFCTFLSFGDAYTLNIIAHIFVA